MRVCWGSKPYVIKEGAKYGCHVTGEGADPLSVEEVDDVRSFIHGLHDPAPLTVTENAHDFWQLGPQQLHLQEGERLDSMGDSMGDVLGQPTAAYHKPWIAQPSQRRKKSLPFHSCLWFAPTGP